MEIIEMDIKIRVERRKIKNLNMYLHPPYDEVLVTAPIHMPESVIRNFISDKKPWMEKNLKRLREKDKEAAFLGLKEPDEKLKAECVRRLELFLPGLIELWQERLGVSLASYKLRVMKTCWGVCHCKKRTVTFNKLLGLKSPDLVEYIVVHELCHLIEPSHNKRFHGLMDRYLPDWRSRKKRLNSAESSLLPS